MITSLSFSQLEKTLQDKVLRCAKNCGDERPDTWPVDPKSVLLNRLDLPGALARSKRFIQEVEPIAFPWLTENQATYYEEELSFAFYLALADCELAVLENRANLSSRREHLLHVGGLLAQLRNRDLKPAEAKVAAQLAHDADDPTRYFGLIFIAPKMTKVIKALTIDKISEQVEAPASLNDGRLYLVWATEMLNNICSLLHRSMRYISFFAANAILNGVSFVTGSMGWMLYFLRGGVDTAFLFEVSDEIKALGLSDEDKSKCFSGKWYEKKFSILNDAVWGLVNCICFFILTGDGIFGFYGNVLNFALFGFDFALGAWALSEAQTEYEAIINDYQNDIDAITENIQLRKHKIKLAPVMNELRKSESTTGSEQDQLDIILRAEWRLKALKRDKGKAEREWSYKLKKYQLDKWYSGLIIGAFAVLCAFFFPPFMAVPFTNLMFAMVGSALCFGLGIVHAGLTSQFEMLKTGEDSVSIEQDYKDYLQLFKEAGTEEHSKRMIFLDIRRTMAKTDYQKQLLQYQRAEMACRLLTDMLVPALFLAAFVFMPMTLGVSVFVVGIMLMLLAKLYVAELAPDDVREDSISLRTLTSFSGLFKQQKPEEAQKESEHPLLPAPFPETEYQGFCADFDKGVSAKALKKHFLPQSVAEPPQNEASGEIYPEG